jgi:signal transduction histidine kinase
MMLAAGIFLISLLHYSVPPLAIHWHNALQNLYYLPIVLTGLIFGWLGGLAAAVFAGLTSIPYNIAIWNLQPNDAINHLWDIPLFCAAGVLIGVLAERGRKQRAALERTTARLTEVYRELQDNFERMKRAERLFALGQLSAGLAHEVRNPLASIAGAAGFLQRRGSLDARDAECLAIIGKECRRLDELVTHFIAFARPRLPSYRITDVGRLIDSVIELASHAIGGRAISLEKRLSDIAPIECDPELLQQVLLNLVINAIQATEDGGEVLVSARQRDGRVHIDVRDEGCGLSPEIRDRIFDPFFTTKENGTGLGLSVAHQIVEQHGGVLTATANPSRGMTFSVVLPLLQEKQHVT